VHACSIVRILSKLADVISEQGALFSCFGKMKELLGLRNRSEWRKGNAFRRLLRSHREFDLEPSQPRYFSFLLHVTLIVCCLTKKGEREAFTFSMVYFFLSISAIIAMPTAAIAATMMPIPGSMYWSAKDAGACVGSGVASGAGSTTNAVAACEP